MGCTPRWSAALAAGFLAALALPLAAQEKAAPSRVGMLAPSAAPAAVQEFEGAFNGYHMWLMTSALEHGRKAVDAEPTFGLARAYVAELVGGPTRTAELDRAVADAAKGTAAEAVLALAFREMAAGRAENTRKLLDAAVALAPNDPAVAVERALSFNGNARVDALRDVSKKFVDDAASRIWLAYFLTNPTPGFARGDALEALEQAQAALRIAPNSAGAVTAVAHVLERLGRHDEAMTYIDRAIEMKPTSDYAFLVKHEILLRDGKPAEARAALDPLIGMTGYPGTRIALLRAQAMTLAYEGKIKEAQVVLADAATRAENMQLKQQAAWSHVYAALIAGGARDPEIVQKEIAEARRLGSTGPDLDRNEVIALALAGRPTLARQALENLKKSMPGSGLARENTLRMLNGLVLVAEDKPADALPELKVMGDNGYAQIGIVEAYRKLGKRAEAEVARKAILDRKDFDWNATSIQIAHFRLK